LKRRGDKVLRYKNQYFQDGIDEDRKSKSEEPVFLLTAWISEALT
jgi:hypothetical protein